MHAEADFIDAIFADLDNDEPRLIFADWLEENGDSERAEFIRLQIEIESLRRSQPKVPGPLVAREQALREANLPKWLRDPLLFQNAKFVRGLPAFLRVPSPYHYSSCGSIWWGVAEIAGLFVAASRIGTFVRITWEEGLLNDHLKLLELFSQLQEVRLGYSDDLNDTGMRHLGKAHQIKKLQLLWTTRLSAFALHHLSGLSNLEEFILENQPSQEQVFVDASLEPIAQMQQLRRLTLFGFNRLSDVGLMSLSQLRRLEFLKLQACKQLTADGLGKLQAALPRTQIQAVLRG